MRVLKEQRTENVLKSYVKVSETGAPSAIANTAEGSDKGC